MLDLLKRTYTRIRKYFGCINRQDLYKNLEGRIIEDCNTRLLDNGDRIPNVEAYLFGKCPRLHMFMRVDRILRMKRLIDSCAKEILPPVPVGEECSICMEREATCVAQPCGHHATCRSCSATIVINSLLDDSVVTDGVVIRCILCRGRVLRFQYFEPDTDEAIIRKSIFVRRIPPPAHLVNRKHLDQRSHNQPLMVSHEPYNKVASKMPR